MFKIGDGVMVRKTSMFTEMFTEQRGLIGKVVFLDSHYQEEGYLGVQIECEEKDNKKHPLLCKPGRVIPYSNCYSPKDLAINHLTHHIFMLSRVFKHNL